MTTAARGRAHPELMLPAAKPTGLEKLAQLLFLLGCFLVPLLKIRLIGDNVTLSDACFGANALILAAFGRRRGLPPIGARQVAAALCLLGGVTAGFMADELAGSLSTTGRLLFIVLIWPWQARASLWDRRAVVRAIQAWIAGCTLFALYSIYVARFDAEAVASSYGRVAGLVGQNVSDAGGILCIAVPFLVGMLIGGRRKLLTAAGLGAVGSALVLTGSVSGYISAIGAALVTIWLFRRQLTFGAFVIAGGVIAGAAYFASWLQIESDLGISIFSRFQSTTSGRYDTLASRQETWLFALDRLSTQPFLGVGLDTASGLADNNFSVHNTWLMLWYQGGLLTLLGVLIFVGHVWNRARRIPHSDVWATSLKGAAVAGLLFTMTSPLAAQRYLWMPAIFLLVIAYGKLTPNASATPS